MAYNKVSYFSHNDLGFLKVSAVTFVSAIYKLKMSIFRDKIQIEATSIMYRMSANKNVVQLFLKWNKKISKNLKVPSLGISSYLPDLVNRSKGHLGTCAGFHGLFYDQGYGLRIDFMDIS